jgi:hypothetical protein
MAKCPLLTVDPTAPPADWTAFLRLLGKLVAEEKGTRAGHEASTADRKAPSSLPPRNGAAALEPTRAAAEDSTTNQTRTKW